MYNLNWLNKQLVDNLKNYDLSIFSIRNVKQVEIMSFIQDDLKVKVVSESLKFENKFFTNIIDIKINIFNNHIMFKNIYVKKYPNNFIDANIYLKDNWENLIKSEGK